MKITLGIATTNANLQHVIVLVAKCYSDTLSMIKGVMVVS